MNSIDIQLLNNRLETLTLEEVLTECYTIFDGQLAFASSLGLEDQIITHSIATSSLSCRVFTLDTGRLFPETYELIDRTNARYKMKIEMFFPNYEAVEKMVYEKGANLFYDSIENRKLCCSVRKTQPLNRALQGLKAWITGLRREQSITRHDIRIVEWDEMHNLYKINPLINWSEADVKEYIRKNNIPFNTLHDKGFPSIGCQPCTRAIMAGEDIRAGRWWWENPDQKECGLHK
ncbi:MAG: phosphoadenylyl-sulfate reductase [Bacteroidales bacterium]|nr:phosphoadenylyl-sulfate reductase [Bacteroidales bacterium]